MTRVIGSPAFRSSGCRDQLSWSSRSLAGSQAASGKPAGGPGIEMAYFNLREGRFVCMRRANDISQDGSLVLSSQSGYDGVD